jgi:hypothetical protein
MPDGFEAISGPEASSVLLGMTRISSDGKAPFRSGGGTSPPVDAVEVGTYDLLVNAGSVIGPLADEMAVWLRGRPVQPESGGTPTDLEHARIWVRAVDADRARQLLAKLAPRPPTQEDFEREETMGASEPRGATAVRRLLVTLFVLGTFLTLMAALQRCGG